MSARNHVTYSPTERASFELVPPTCEAIEAKSEELVRFFDTEIADAALRGNRVEPTPQIMAAVREAVSRHLWPALKELELAAKMEGTYPLRLALIQQIERRGLGAPQDSHYPRWIEEGRGRLCRMSLARAAIAKAGGAA